MKECYWPELPEMGEPKPSAVEFYTVPLYGEKVKKSSYGTGFMIIKWWGIAVNY